MNPSDLPPTYPSPGWLTFSGILFIICIVVAVFTILFFLFRKFNPRKTRKRRRHEHRRQNPTRAQVGGLPPPRPPGEFPRGP